MGNDELPRIGHRDAEQDGAEQGRADGVQADTLGPGSVGPDCGCSQLDYGVLNRDRKAAATAASPQKNPGEHRNVLVPGECLAAAGTPRPGPHHRLLRLRTPAENADIE